MSAHIEWNGERLPWLWPSLEAARAEAADLNAMHGGYAGADAGFRAVQEIPRYILGNASKRRKRERERYRAGYFSHR